MAMLTDIGNYIKENPRESLGLVLGLAATSFGALNAYPQDVMPANYRGTEKVMSYEGRPEENAGKSFVYTGMESQGVVVTPAKGGKKSYTDDSTGTGPDDADTAAISKFSFRNVNNIFPQYEDALGILRGLGNEDSLYNKVIDLGNGQRMVFADYRDIRTGKLEGLSGHQKKIVQGLFPPHIQAYGSDGRLDVPFSDTTARKIAGKLPRGFGRMDLPDALKAVAEILSEGFSYDKSDAFMRDHQTPEEMYLAGNGVCRHYTPVYDEMLRVASEFNKDIRKFTQGALNTGYTMHSVPVLAARSKRDTNTIVMTLVDPTWYDTRIEDPAANGKRSAKTVGDIFGAYDKAHASDMSIMEQVSNWENEVTRVDFKAYRALDSLTNRFYLDYFRNSGKDDLNHYIAGVDVYYRLPAEEKLEILKGLKGLAGDRWTQKDIDFEMKKLEFKAGKISPEDFLELSKDWSYDEMRDAQKRVMNKYLKNGDYEKIAGNFNPDDLDLNDICMGEGRSVGGGIRITSIYVIGKSLNIFQYTPDLPVYIKACSELLESGSGKVTKGRVIELYEKLFEMSDDKLERVTDKYTVMSEKYMESYERMKNAVREGNIPDEADFERIYLECLY